MKRSLLSIIVFFFIGIPIWIRAISFKRWQPFVRMVVIAVLCLFSIGFYIYLVINTLDKLTNFSVWFTYIVLVGHLIAVIISAYFSWPR